MNSQIIFKPLVDNQFF